MTEFRYVTLEGIADNCSGAIKIGPFGSELKKEDMSASGPRVYGQEDVIAGDFSAEVRRISLRKFQGLAQFELKPGDVVVTMMGSIGHCAVFPNYAEQGIMDSHLLRVRPDRKLMISEFLAVLLSYSGTVAQISQLAHGSIMSGLNSRIVRSLTIPIPSIPEQERIVEVLDTIEAHIAQIKDWIARAKTMRISVFLQLMQHGVGKDGVIRDLECQASEFKHSMVGPIPRDWSVQPMENLLADVDPAMRSGPFGSALLKEELRESGIPLLGIDNVQVENFVGTFSRFVDSSKFRDLRRYAVRPGDLMITIMGTVGRCCLVPNGLKSALSSKHVWTITLDTTKYRPLLACLQINYAPWVLRHFGRDMQGGIMSAIRSDTLRSTPLPVPPLAEQMRIEEQVVEWTSSIGIEEERLAKLELFKQGLLDDLLTGRVRMTDGGMERVGTG